MRVSAGVSEQYRRHDHKARYFGMSHWRVLNIAPQNVSTTAATHESIIEWSVIGYRSQRHPLTSMDYLYILAFWVNLNVGLIPNRYLKLETIHARLSTHQEKRWFIAKVRCGECHGHQ